MAGERRVRVFVKKQIRIDRLTFNQRQMHKLGNVGLASRKNEIAQAKNARGGPAKPLSKGYAIRKSRISKFGGRGRNRRDLHLRGDMLREWQVRTVSSKEARAGWSTRLGRAKAQRNNAIEEFVSWSPENTRAVLRAGDRVLNEASKRIALERLLNG